MTKFEDVLAADRLRRGANQAPAVSAESFVKETVEQFGNRATWPQFMLLLPGMPALAAESVLRGSPVQLMVKGHPEWEGLHSQFVADLASAAAERPGRDLKTRVRADAERVGVALVPPPENSRSRKRIAYLTPPDLRSALAYVLNTIISGDYGKRLARCSLQGCPRFFFRDVRRGQPERYCCPAHSTEANRLDAPNRARDARARKRAIEVLITHGIKRTLAPELIRAVKARGLTAEELVKRAETKRTADEAAKPARHK